MNAGIEQRDLIVMVADADAEAAVRSLLSGRAESLGISRISFQIQRYVKRDSGCCRDSHEFLRPFLRQFRFALVLFDRHGSGRDSHSAEAIESDLEGRLAQNGWVNRSAVLVLDPELESWVWSDSPEVEQVLGWSRREPSLRRWLFEQQHLREGDVKPRDPKDAMEKALRIARKPRSSALFGILATRVGLHRCTDRSFQKFRHVLHEWFPVR